MLEISSELVSRDMDTEVRKVPLGVTSAYVWKLPHSCIN